MMETTKNIDYAKGESIVNHSIETRLFKRFHLDSKNFDHQAMSIKPKTMDYKAVFVMKNICTHPTQNGHIVLLAKLPLAIHLGHEYDVHLSYR